MTEFLILEEPEEEDQEIVSKEECPYCGWSGKSLERHLKYCKKNPENKIKKIESKLEIPDFNQLIQFCEKHAKVENGIIIGFNDYEIEQFYKHTIPRRLHKTRYQEDRGGGGWSGAVKAALVILNKMKKEGVLK